MKKIVLILLVILAILILTVIMSHLIGIDNFNKKFNIDKENFPLWASIGVIISALMATTSSALTIENTNKQNELNKIKQKSTEFNYALHHLVKIKMTFSNILENLGKLHQYSDVELEKIRKDAIIFADKLDSKDLFYFLSRDSERNSFVWLFNQLKLGTTKQAQYDKASKTEMGLNDNE